MHDRLLQILVSSPLSQYLDMERFCFIVKNVLPSRSYFETARCRLLIRTCDYLVFEYKQSELNEWLLANANWPVGHASTCQNPKRHIEPSLQSCILSREMKKYGSDQPPVGPVA